ncbi:hypothetical protein LAD67_06475 [Escherichia coli]|nr:hypothetical protein [Escherichia coli]
MKRHSLTDDQRLASVLARDPNADRRIRFSPCAPRVSLPFRLARARPCLRENVSFYGKCPARHSPAGFRPCKRCQPDKAMPATSVG